MTEPSLAGRRNMAITKEQKKAVVEKIKENLKKQKVIFFIDFEKSKAHEIFNLRNKLKEAGALLYVARKSLINIAFKNEKISVDMEQFQGQLGLVFGFEDEILPIKTIYNLSKERDLPLILGGFFQKQFIDAQTTIELAKLPSREELLTQLLNGLSTPMFNFANVLGGNIRSLLLVLSNIKSNQ